MRRIAALVALVALAVLAVAWWAVTEPARRALEPLPVDQPGVIVVETGDGVSRLTMQLAARGLIDSSRATRWWLRRHATVTGMDKRMHAGEFRLLPGDTFDSLLNRIVDGDVISYQLTIIDGWTVSQLLSALAASRLRQTDGLTADTLVARLSLSTPNAEGWFLPDTYRYVATDTDVGLLSRAHLAMRTELDRQWSRRAPGLPYQTPYDALIVASLVEKESGIAEERPLIASVFVERLRRGMRLQTDPSVIYGLGAAFDGNLTRRHLESPTPYNTYTMTGLPPTPIALPGKAALSAAMQPAPARYLYFVGRGDGTSEFSRTLAEHNKAVNRYQRRPARQSGGQR
ncbi:MAG: endolytic transglycosylase MltG [Pseudomonadales bacterium]|nr:endolytic transglycosylase MltG [Pseudomonadales bacterium]